MNLKSREELMNQAFGSNPLLKYSISFKIKFPSLNLNSRKAVWFSPLQINPVEFQSQLFNWFSNNFI